MTKNYKKTAEKISADDILLKKITKKLIPKNELFSGAGYEARTRYLDLGKVALYQMS